MDQLKGMVQMVEIPELNLVQAQRYVLLYFDDIDHYHGLVQLT